MIGFCVYLTGAHLLILAWLIGSSSWNDNGSESDTQAIEAVFRERSRTFRFTLGDAFWFLEHHSEVSGSRFQASDSETLEPDVWHLILIAGARMAPGHSETIRG